MKMQLFLVTALFIGACKQAPKGVPAKHQAPQHIAAEDLSASLLVVNTKDSRISWKGTKIGGWHAGEVRLNDGFLRVKDQVPVSGAFTINMGTIVNTDIPDSDPIPKKKIVEHLMGKDFFDVADHPLSTFQITSTKPAEEEAKVWLSGNLTLRGVTRNITFLADVQPAPADSFKAFADFNINRQEWGVSYKGAKDELVHDQVNLKVYLVAGQSL